MDIEEEDLYTVFTSKEEKDGMSEKINNLISVINRFGKELNFKDFSFFFDDADEPYIELYDENGTALARIYARVW